MSKKRRTPIHYMDGDRLVLKARRLAMETSGRSNYTATCMLQAYSRLYPDKIYRKRGVRQDSAPYLVPAEHVEHFRAFVRDYARMMKRPPKSAKTAKTVKIVKTAKSASQQAAYERFLKSTIEDLIRQMNSHGIKPRLRLLVEARAA